MFKRPRARAAVALVLGGCLALAACGSSESNGNGNGNGNGTGSGADAGTGGDEGQQVADGSLEALIEAAEAEGQLIWYQTAEERIGQRVADAFSEKYNIDVSFNRLNSSQMEQRFSAEMEAGAPAADVIIPLHAAFFQHAMAEGWLVPLADADIPDFPAAHLPEAAVLDDDGTVVISITQYGFGYNSELVSEDEAPTTWEDLLDPRWDGHILMSDPTISTVYTDLYYLVEQEYGIDYLEQLGAEQPLIFQGAAPMGEALAAGEGHLAIPLPVEYMANLRDQNGAPLAWTMPDVWIGAPSVIGVVNEAEHPNAARLFAHWLMSEEGLEVFTSSIGTVNPINTDEWPTELSGPALAELSGERQADIYEALGF